MLWFLSDRNKLKVFRPVPTRKKFYKSFPPGHKNLLLDRHPSERIPINQLESEAKLSATQQAQFFWLKKNSQIALWELYTNIYRKIVCHPTSTICFDAKNPQIVLWELEARIWGNIVCHPTGTIFFVQKNPQIVLWELETKI